MTTQLRCTSKCNMNSPLTCLARQCFSTGPLSPEETGKNIFLGGSELQGTKAEAANPTLSHLMAITTHRGQYCRCHSHAVREVWSVLFVLVVCQTLMPRLFVTVKYRLWLSSLGFYWEGVLPFISQCAASIADTFTYFWKVHTFVFIIQPVMVHFVQSTANWPHEPT